MGSGGFRGEPWGVPNLELMRLEIFGVPPFDFWGTMGRGLVFLFKSLFLNYAPSLKLTTKNPANRSSQKETSIPTEGT